MELLFSHARTIRTTLLRDVGDVFKRFVFNVPDVWRASPDCTYANLEDVPAFQRHNPHILTGYRKFSTRSECLWGVLSWNNETVNIWSNLVTLGLLVALLVEDHTSRYDALGISLPDRCLSTGLAVSYGAMLLLSALYHLFNCTSEHLARYWYLWDVFGIVFSVVSYVVGFTVLQFRSHPFWMSVHLVAEATVAVAPFTLACLPRYGAERHDHRRIRGIGVFVLFSLVPLVHSALLNDATLLRNTLPGHVTIFLVLLMSFVVFSTRLPEAKCPGAVDLLGSSHQIWHLGISVSALAAHELFFAYFQS